MRDVGVHRELTKIATAIIFSPEVLMGVLDMPDVFSFQKLKKFLGRDEHGCRDISPVLRGRVAYSRTPSPSKFFSFYFVKLSSEMHPQVSQTHRVTFYFHKLA